MTGLQVALPIALIVGSPEDFWAFTKAEIEKWERVIKLSGTKVD
jgi:hypothetical protein